MILFYVVYRVLLLSLTKSILEKKRKRAVFHKLIITTRVVGAKKDRFRERGKESKKNHQKRNFMPIYSLAFFHVLFFVLSSLFFNETK